ncbi:MAG: hypothetical protein PVG75_04120 [Thioalkalispiraceae bacterium]|jgi:hypothetical protein
MRLTDFKVLLVIVSSMFVILSCADVKQTGRDIGHTTRDATRSIGHATRDITREIGHGTRDAVKAVGQEIKRATGPLSK